MLMLMLAWLWFVRNQVPIKIFFRSDHYFSVHSAFFRG